MMSDAERPIFVSEYQDTLAKAERVADTLVALLPPDAPADLLRPMLVQQAGMMILQYGPETVDDFVAAMGRCAAYMQNGDREKAAEELAPFGMNLDMIAAMSGADIS